MEIYLEELKDLFKPGACKLKLRESIFAGVWVEGLHQAFVPSAQAAMQVRRQWAFGFEFLRFEHRLVAHQNLKQIHISVVLLWCVCQLVEKGLSRRTSASTGMNDLSSRSHCILTLTVECQRQVKNSQS